MVWHCDDELAPGSGVVLPESQRTHAAADVLFENWPVAQSVQLACPGWFWVDLPAAQLEQPADETQVRLW